LPLSRHGLDLVPPNDDQSIRNGRASVAVDLQIHDPPVVHGCVIARVDGEDERSGTRHFDARLVALMHVHSVTRILTFNTEDFHRYPGIVVVDPREVAG